MRLAVVGCGLIGAKRCDAAKGHQIVVVCDPDAAPRGVARRAHRRARRRRLARGGSPPTSNRRRGDAARPARRDRAGCRGGRASCLVEKPAGRTAAELRPVAAAAAARGVLVKVGFNHRFHPAFQRARAIVAEGALGRR
jgi:predicted dehydrogenase